MNRIKEEESTESPGRTRGNKNLIISEISSLGEGKNRLPPLILHFKHAPHNTDEFINQNVAADIQLKGWSNFSPDLTVKLATPHIPFISSEDPQDTYYTTYLAIRDTNTGKTRLIEARNVSMKPDVEAPKTTNPLLLSAEFEDGEERMEVNKNLTKTFGQRKGQRFYENRDTFKVDAEDTADRVRRAAGNVSQESIATPVIEQTLDIVPPRDATAGRADMVYRVEHLLSDLEVGEMVKACTTLLEEYNSAEALEQGLQGKVFSPIGVHFLNKLLSQPGELDYRAALTLYLDAIVRFTKLRPAELTKGLNSLPKYLPTIVKMKILDQFSVGQRNNRLISPEYRDKAVCYIIVLGLMLNSCALDVSLLTESVRIESRNLKKLVMLTGANLELDPGTRQQKIILRKTLATYDVTYVAKKKKGRK